MLVNAMSRLAFFVLQVDLVLAQQQVLLRQSNVQALALGDVVVDGDPAAVGCGLAGDEDGPAIVQFADLRPRIEERAVSLATVFLDVCVRVEVICDEMLEDVRDRSARAREAGREIVHLDIALVADHDVLVGIDHAQAVRHVRKRRLEATVLRAQLLLALAQGLVLAPQLPRGAPLRSRVAQGVDLVRPPAALQGPAYDLDRDDQAARGLEQRLGRLCRPDRLPSPAVTSRSSITPLPSSSSEVRCVSWRMRRLTFTIVPSCAMTRPSCAASTSSWLLSSTARSAWLVISIAASMASITTMLAAGDRDRQRCIVDVGARQRHGGIGGEHHRSHGREVQTADGNHQQCRTDPRRPSGGPTRARRGGRLPRAQRRSGSTLPRGSGPIASHREVPAPPCPRNA